MTTTAHPSPTDSPARRPGWNRTLWVTQGLLAPIFLFTGATKLLLPLAKLQSPIALPGPLIRFIGVAEVLGALGLILPGLLRIHIYLTPLAACGLIIIMIGATAYTVLGIGMALALMPLTVGILCVVVARGRWTWFSQA